MDYFKKSTIKDYTIWDLNCKYVIIRDKHKQKKKFIRKARRKNKQELKNQNSL